MDWRAKWREQTARTRVKLRLTDEPANSRLGGEVPEEAPTDSEGKPMGLLVMLDFSELTLPEEFPKKGILRIYVANNAMLGMDYEDHTSQKDFRVRYDEEFTPVWREGITEPPFPVRETVFVHQGGTETVAMPATDPRFDKGIRKLVRRELDGEEWESMWLPEPGCGMAGYAWFTQGDSREGNPDLLRYDTVLLQLRDPRRLHIGDEGVMNFLIPEEKLKKCEFDDVFLGWDCY